MQIDGSAVPSFGSGIECGKRSLPTVEHQAQGYTIKSKLEIRFDTMQGGDMIAGNFLMGISGLGGVKLP